MLHVLDLCISEDFNEVIFSPSSAFLGSAVKHVYHNKRSHYDLDKSQRNAPFKKRKLFDRSSVVTYDGGISCESVSNSPEKSTDGEKNASAGKLTEGLFHNLFLISADVSDVSTNRNLTA